MHLRNIRTFRTSRREMVLGERTLVMGILNVTPDSFSDGGDFFSPSDAVERGVRMVAEGADVIDVGGESTRPGSDPVSLEEETRRVVPVIKALGQRVAVPISVDTTKSAVARQAIEAGAEIINDISAMRFDDEMGALAAETGAGLILMHMRGIPRSMQSGSLAYPALIDEIIDFLRERLECAQSAGVELRHTMVDPGIGFGKKMEDNLRILKSLERFQILERPVVTGVSRKSFIGGVLGGEPKDRLEGTAAAVAVSIMKGSYVVRVHDVAAMKKIALMADAIMGS